MKQLNTLPIEDFLDKARVAIKTNQKTINLTIKEVSDLQNSLSVVMTRLAGELDAIVAQGTTKPPEIRIDGGRF